VRFWDSSAIVPLLVEEKNSRRMRDALRADPVMLTWWATEIECASAVARMERDQLLAPAKASGALQRLRQHRDAWHEIEPAIIVRETAKRLVRVYPLRAGDSLQLAAALVAAAHQASSLVFVCLDERLAAVAEREGFPVIR
jgi:predicted nucleic acid-binding protein